MAIASNTKINGVTIELSADGQTVAKVQINQTLSAVDDPSFKKMLNKAVVPGSTDSDALLALINKLNS